MNERQSPWTGRKVFVTGCTEFLGGAVVRELLAAGAGVVGLVRDKAAEATFSRHKLSGRVWAVHGRAEDGFRLHSAVAVHEVGAVLHLTRSDTAQPDRGAAAVIEAARRYDPRTPVVMARPALANGPASAVRATEPPIPLGIARFGELFGPGDTAPPRTLPGNTPRDFVYVMDAARACLRLAEHLLERPAPRREDVTFQSGWVFTDRTMATAVREAAVGRPVPPAGPTPPNPLGWSPARSFTDALAETIAWHQETSGPQLPAPLRAAA